MDIKNTDLKVMGRIVSITTDGVIADTEQLYDSIIKKNQQTINKDVKTDIKDIKNSLSEITIGAEGKFVKQEDSIPVEQIKDLFS